MDSRTGQHTRTVPFVDSQEGQPGDIAADIANGHQPGPLRQLARRTDREIVQKRSARGRPRRGQLLSWTVLVGTVLLSSALGGTLYLTLDAIDLAADKPLGDASWWLSLTVVTLCALLLCLLLTIVAVFRSRPRLKATLALVLALLLPPLAAFIGLKYGIEAFSARAGRELTDFTGELAAAIIEILAGTGIDPRPFAGLIKLLLGH